MGPYAFGSTIMITILQQKISALKTPVSADLAKHLGKMGYSVLVVDANPQGNTSKAILGIQARHTLADCFSGGEVDLLDAGYFTNTYRICIISSGRERFSELLRALESAPQKLKTFQKALLALKANQKMRFDFVLIDTGTTLDNPLRETLLSVSDYLLSNTDFRKWILEAVRNNCVVSIGQAKGDSYIEDFCGEVFERIKVHHQRNKNKTEDINA